MIKHSFVFATLFLLLSLSACTEDNATPAEDEKPYGHFSYYGLTVSSNPSNYTKSETITHEESYWAEIIQSDSTQRLKIHTGGQYHSLDVTVTFTGVGNYSTLNADLAIQSTGAYNGLYTPSYSSDPQIPGTGGYMEILSHDNNIITGNLRFILGSWVQESGSYKYTGIDDCTFEIKLR